MLHASIAGSYGLGGFREDVVGVLGPILGTGRVNQFITSLEQKIRSEAEAGARNAIPDIKLEVEQTAKSAVTPIVTWAIVAGALGLVVGSIALWRTRRRAA